MNLNQRRLAALWGWSLLGAAFLIVMIAPSPQTSATATAAREPAWDLPRLPAKIDVAPAIPALAKGNLWGGQSTGTAEPDTRALQWRMSGIVGAGKDRTVLVQFADDRILPVKVGDKFPDGTPVLEIRETGVCVNVEGKKRFLAMPGQSTAIIW